MSTTIPAEVIDRASEAHRRAISLLLNYHEVGKVSPLQDNKDAIGTRLSMVDGRVATVLTYFAPTEYGVPGFDTKVEWE